MNLELKYKIENKWKKAKKMVVYSRKVPEKIIGNYIIWLDAAGENEK